MSERPADRRHEKLEVHRDCTHTHAQGHSHLHILVSPGVWGVFGLLCKKRNKSAWNKPRTRGNTILSVIKAEDAR